MYRAILIFLLLGTLFAIGLSSIFIQQNEESSYHLGLRTGSDK